MTQPTLSEDLLGPPGGDDDMLRTAWLSDDSRYRWLLNRYWGSGPYLGWIMLNPSTADAVGDDPTIRRCIGFARSLGFGGISVANLYALRTPDPKVLAAARWETGGRQNDRILRAMLQESVKSGGMVIAAWGAHARPERVAWLAEQPYADRLHALGVTKDGAPKHPLARGRSRIPDDALPITWSPAVAGHCASEGQAQ